MLLPKSDVLTLVSVADGLYPPPLGGSIPPNVRCSELEGFVDALSLGISLHLNDLDQLALKFLATSLRSGALTAVLFGKLTTRSFVDMSLPDRAELLGRICTSRYGARRMVFNSFKRLILGTVMSYVDGQGPSSVKKDNPLWETLGYPGPPKPEAAVTGSFPFSDYTKSKECVEGSVYDYVVIGSGSGGSAVAKTLADGIKGAKILVVEKGNWIPDNLSEISQVESEGMSTFYEKGSLLTSDDSSIMILAGCALGGGSTINWGCCLDTPSYVRKEWREDYGVDWVDSDEFEGCLREVKEEMGVHDAIKRHSVPNQKLIYGCDKNNYKWHVAPQNIKDTGRDSAGWTCFGPKQGTYAKCVPVGERARTVLFLPPRYNLATALPHSLYSPRWLVRSLLAGNKQGGGITWLRDFCRSGNGTLFRGHAITVARRKVVLAPEGGLHDKKSHFTVRVRNKVIVSCGSLHTPLVLTRSGCVNKNIGKNLHLHPVTALLARCRDDVHGYKGKSSSSSSSSSLFVVLVASS